MFYLGVQYVDQRGEFIFLFLHFFLSFLFVIGKDIEVDFIQKVGKNCNSVNWVNFLLDDLGKTAFFKVPLKL